MSASNAFEAAILDLVFLNINAANIGDASGLRSSTTAGVFYISLHTADPGETGTQATSETAYTGYARVAVARSGAGFTRSVSTISNTAETAFGNCTAAPGAALTHFGIGSDLSGAGNLFLSGPLGASYQPAIGNFPRFAAGALATSSD